MKNKKIKLIIFNKYIIILILIFMCLVTGSTYSYLAYKYENNSTIKGNVVSVNVDLKVELLVGDNKGLVPLKDESLDKAIKGTGGKSACIDANNNLSCQVYKITLNNKGSKIDNLIGTISLYKKDGSSNYNNLKWRELSDETTVKTNSIINDMTVSNLVTNLTLKSKETKVYYIAVYIQENNKDQLNTDRGKFAGTVTFRTVNNAEGNLLDLVKRNAQTDTNIDFSKASSDTNGKGVYIKSGTENDTNPIYYYRGSVLDNNLIFANMCFKIVRTTETGGVKLIYNGLPHNGSCDNIGEKSQLPSTKRFNDQTIYTSLSSVGYMYGSINYKAQVKNITTSYTYGTNVTYNNGKYTLTNPITNEWGNIYNQQSGIYTHHYTCLTTSDTCDNVFYIFKTTNKSAGYISLSNGKNIENAISEMLDYNTNSSTIKGSKDDDGTIDNWYYTNIDNKGYSNYIEDTIFCNDRTIYDKGGWEPNGGITTKGLLFSANYRTQKLYSANLSCSRDIDKFTVNSNIGNGLLNYPVGLLTADEILLASPSSNAYLHNNTHWWTMSPSQFFSTDEGVSIAFEHSYFVSGSIGQYGVNFSFGLRPSISLNKSTKINEGDGTVEAPFLVE